jgi:hypothetical protein
VFFPELAKSFTPILAAVRGHDHRFVGVCALVVIAMQCRGFFGIAMQPSVDLEGLTGAIFSIRRGRR